MQFYNMLYSYSILWVFHTNNSCCLRGFEQWCQVCIQQELIHTASQRLHWRWYEYESRCVVYI